MKKLFAFDYKNHEQHGNCPKDIDGVYAGRRHTVERLMIVLITDNKLFA